MPDGKPLFDNPEVAAMAAICEILQNLEDDAARLRVMHWAFGRFNPAFKRAADAPPVSAVTPAPAVERRVSRPVERVQVPIERASPIDPPVAPPQTQTDADFGQQISELQDFFTQPASKRLLV